MDTTSTITASPERVSAPGGWRRAVVGLAVGAVFGTLVRRILSP